MNPYGDGMDGSGKTSVFSEPFFSYPFLPYFRFAGTLDLRNLDDPYFRNIRAVPWPDILEPVHSCFFRGSGYDMRAIRRGDLAPARCKRQPGIKVHHGGSQGGASVRLSHSHRCEKIKMIREDIP